MPGIAWRFRTPLRTSRVVFAGPHFQAAFDLTQDLLRERDGGRLADVVQLIHAPTDQALMEEAPDADVALPFMQRFDSTFIHKARRVRLIQQFGVGLEGVDVNAATQRGIAVSNIPAVDTGNAEATAEHALLLSLSLLRQTAAELPRRFRDRQLGGLPIPRSIYGKNVTVLGYGAVGSKVCEYFLALGANVTAVRRDWSSSSTGRTELSNIVQQSTSLREALPTTDILILACPMTPETRHIINDETLQLLPPTSLVTNIGRGPLVEYDAIRRAIETNRIAGFASDVGVGHSTKPSEPWDPNDPLSKHPHTLFTPHVGGYTDYSYGTMVESVVDAIENVMHGRPPEVWVNRDDNTALT